MRRIPFLLLVVVAAAFLPGCEHDGDDSLDLTVYASNDRLHEGERCVLVAHLRDDDADDNIWFGDYVTWSLSDPTIGHLSGRTGRRVVYYPDRIPVAPEKELVQTVYCKYDAPLEFSHHTRRKIHHLVKRHP